MVNHLTIPMLGSYKTPTVKGSSFANRVSTITNILRYQSKLLSKIDLTTSFVYNPANFNLTITFAEVGL